MRDEAQYQQVYERMSRRGTEELLVIWAKNDRVEWSDLTFAVIKEILQERSVAPVAQYDPVYTHPSSKNVSDKLKEFLGISEEADRLSATGETASLFYKPQKVTALQKWINLTVILVIVVNVVATILSFFSVQWTVLFSGDRRALVSTTLSILFALVVNILFPVIALKGLSYILKILMQFEFNSRTASMKNTKTAGEDRCQDSATV
jgi:hypothetical protein